MNIGAYLSSNFPGVDLTPSLYHQWPAGIHFSLGRDLYQFTENDELNIAMFETVYKQTAALFEELFAPEDQVMLVANVYEEIGAPAAHPAEIFETGLNDGKLLEKLDIQTKPYPFETDEPHLYTIQQASLLCRAKNLNAEHLLKCAAHADFPLQLRFTADSVHYPHLFFVNISENIIYFVYDDRGCEVIARDPSTLRRLCTKYGDWVAEADKADIKSRLGL